MYIDVERVSMSLLMFDDVLSHKILQKDKNQPKQTLKHLKQEKREREIVEGESDVEQVSPSNKHWSLTSFSEQGETEESIENRPVNTEKITICWLDPTEMKKQPKQPQEVAKPCVT